MAVTHTPLDVLKAARELISDPAKWTKDSHARDAAGADIYPAEPAAVCFCIIGAIVHVCPAADKESHSVWDALEEVLSEAGGASLPSFNDAPERTHAEVLDLFDKTIARLSAEAR